MNAYHSIRLIRENKYLKQFIAFELFNFLEEIISNFALALITEINANSSMFNVAVANFQIDGNPIFPEIKSYWSMISVESHSKQIKLLNQYIVALEKQVATARKESEEQQKGSSQFAEDIRLMNEDINKLRNQNGQLKFNIARQDDALRRLIPFEKQFHNAREQFQMCAAENNRISTQLQKAQEINKSNEEKIKNLELQLKRKSDQFAQDSLRDKQEIEDLKKNVMEKEKQRDDLAQLLSIEKKSAANRISVMEGSSNDLVKAKNDAIAKLTKDLEELKLRYNRDMTSNSQTRNSLGEQIKQLINTSNEARNESIATRKQLALTKGALDKKTVECEDYSTKFKAKGSDYDNLIKRTNEQKTTLLKNIQRLEDEKSKLQAINSACKGDINENTKALNDAYKRIEQLNSKNIQASQDIASKKDTIAQNQNEISRLTLNLSDSNRQLLKKIEEAKLRQQYIAILKAQVEKANRQIEQLEELKSNNLSNIGQLDQKTNKLKSELSDKAKQLEDKDRSILQKNAIIAQKLNQIQSLQIIQKDQQFTISKLTADVQSKAEALILLSSAKEQLQKKLQSFKNLNDNLDYEVSRLNEELKLTKDQKNALEDEKLELASRQSQILKEKLGDKDLLTKQISSRDKKIQELTSKYEKLEILYNLQTKNSAQAIKKLEAEKSSLSATASETNLEIQNLKKKIQQIQSTLTKTKDAFDLTMQEYNAYRKKKQTQNEELSNQLKDSEKKNQKRAAKIDQLNQEILALQNSHSSQRKNLGDSQKEEMERYKAKFNKNILQLKNENNEIVNKKNLQIDQLKQLIEKTNQQNEQKMKTIKDQFSNKDKSLNQTIKRLQNDKQSLEKEVSRLNLTTITETQSKSSKQVEIEALKRSLQRLEAYSKEQKNAIQQLNKLVQSKIKEIQSLESSNAMLRKQVISSLNHEQTSRKQLLQTKSKVNSIMIHSSSRNSIQDFASSKMDSNARSSVLYKKKKTTFTNKEESDSKALSMSRPKEKQKSFGGQKMKSSLVEDLSQSNFDDLNGLPSTIY